MHVNSENYPPPVAALAVGIEDLAKRTGPTARTSESPARQQAPLSSLLTHLSAITSTFAPSPLRETPAQQWLTE